LWYVTNVKDWESVNASQKMKAKLRLAGVGICFILLPFILYKIYKTVAEKSPFLDGRDNSGSLESGHIRRQLNQPPFSWSLGENNHGDLEMSEDNSTNNHSAAEGKNDETHLASKTCRNSVQGRRLLADDRGYVCNRERVVSSTGCCDISGGEQVQEKYWCGGCHEGMGCCDVYEHCVSCCLDPKHVSFYEFIKEKEMSWCEISRFSSA